MQESNTQGCQRGRVPMAARVRRLSECASTVRPPRYGPDLPSVHSSSHGVETASMKACPSPPASAGSGLQAGGHDLAVHRDLDLVGVRVVLDPAVLEVRNEQAVDGVHVADGQAQRACRPVCAHDLGCAVRVAWDVPGLADLAQGYIRGSVGLFVLGGDHAALKLLDYRATLP